MYMYIYIVYRYICLHMFLPLPMFHRSRPSVSRAFALLNLGGWWCQPRWFNAKKWWFNGVRTGKSPLCYCCLVGNQWMGWLFIIIKDHSPIYTLSSSQLFRAAIIMKKSSMFTGHVPWLSTNFTVCWRRKKILRHPYKVLRNISPVPGDTPLLWIAQVAGNFANRNGQLKPLTKLTCLFGSNTQKMWWCKWQMAFKWHTTPETLGSHCCHNIPTKLNGDRMALTRNTVSGFSLCVHQESGSHTSKYRSIELLFLAFLSPSIFQRRSRLFAQGFELPRFAGPIRQNGWFIREDMGVSINGGTPKWMVHKQTSQSINGWLVGGLVAIFYFPLYWESHHPNWRTHIFQRGGPTTNQGWFGATSSGKPRSLSCGKPRKWWSCWKPNVFLCPGPMMEKMVEKWWEHAEDMISK